MYIRALAKLFLIVRKNCIDETILFRLLSRHVVVTLHVLPHLLVSLTAVFGQNFGKDLFVVLHFVRLDLDGLPGRKYRRRI